MSRRPESLRIIKRFIIQHKYLLLLLIISLAYASPFFQNGFPIGHDNIPQLARTASRIQALIDGQFPVRWAANLNYGYGHPGFIFFYSLPGYLGALFYFFGIGLEQSYKLLMVLVFAGTSLTFYLWVSRIFEKNVAFVAAILYGLAPYSFLNTFVRIHLGESLAMFLIPLVFYFIEKNSQKVNVTYILYGGISYSLLIHSHSILSSIFSFIFAAYIVLKGWKNRKGFVANIYILVIGLLLSAYFILPALAEGKYINSGLFLSDWYKNNFLHFGNIIYSSWGFGSDVNTPGGLSAQIGPVHFLLAFASVIVLFKKIREKRLLVFWLVVFVSGMFMSFSLSDIIWSKVSFLKQFQFPWRFTSVTVFSASVLSGYILSKYKNTFVLITIVIALLILGTTMAKFWRIDTFKPNEFYFTYTGTAAYHNEATTVWVAGDASAYPQKSIELLSGDGEILHIIRKSNNHTFQVKANEQVKILDNTVYFPGWQVLIDGIKTPIEFQDVNHRGLITFTVPSGIHKISVRFTESPIRLLSDVVSVFGVTLLIVSWCYRKRINRIFQRL